MRNRTGPCGNAISPQFRPPSGCQSSGASQHRVPQMAELQQPEEPEEAEGDSLLGGATLSAYHCIHHPDEEVWDQDTQYCWDCHWALRVVESQLTQPGVSPGISRSHPLLCLPRNHAFRKRPSGADQICKTCVDQEKKTSVARMGVEEDFETEVGPVVGFLHLPGVRGLLVRVDPNPKGLDLQHEYSALQASLKAHALSSIEVVTQDLLRAANARAYTGVHRKRPFCRAHRGTSPLPLPWTNRATEANVTGATRSGSLPGL